MSVASIPLPGEPFAARLAMLSMRNAIYTFGKKYPRCGAVFPGIERTSAHMWGQVLMFEGQSCSYGRAFTTCRTSRPPIPEASVILTFQASELVSACIAYKSTQKPVFSLTPKKPCCQPRSDHPGCLEARNRDPQVQGQWWE